MPAGIPDAQFRLQELRHNKSAAIGDKRHKLAVVTAHGHVGLWEVLTAVISEQPTGEMAISQSMEAAETLAIIAHNEPDVASLLLTSLPIVDGCVKLLALDDSINLRLRVLRLLNSIFQSAYDTFFSQELDNALARVVAEIPDDVSTLNTTLRGILIEACQLIVRARKAPRLLIGDARIRHHNPELIQSLISKLRQCSFAEAGSSSPQQFGVILQSLMELATVVIPPQLLRSAKMGYVGPAVFSWHGFMQAQKVSKATDHLFQLTQSQIAGVRIAAIEFLCHVNIDVSEDIFNSDSESGKEPSWVALIEYFVPSLVALINVNSPYLARVGYNLALMCRYSEKSSNMILEVGIAAKLVDIVNTLVASRASPDLVEALLYVVAAVALHSEDLRQYVYSLHAMKSALNVIKWTKRGPHVEGAKIAACQVVRVLSRSVSLLRTAPEFEEATQILAPPLINDDSMSLEVQAAAMSVVCNLLLDFSPAQKTLLGSGILDKIAKSLSSPHAMLRVNSLWALKHAAYEAKPALKQQLMLAVGVVRIINLIRDQDRDMRLQTLTFLRNYTSNYEEGVQFLIDEVGVDDFFRILLDVLDEGNEQLVTEAVYILVHISALGGKFGDCIMAQGALLAKLRAILTVKSSHDLHSAVIWLLINLTSIGTFSATRSTVFPPTDRVQRLVDLEFKEYLAAILRAHPKKLQRASIALEQLASL